MKMYFQTFSNASETCVFEGKNIPVQLQMGIPVMIDFRDFTKSQKSQNPPKSLISISKILKLVLADLDQHNTKCARKCAENFFLGFLPQKTQVCKKKCPQLRFLSLQQTNSISGRFIGFSRYSQCAPREPNVAMCDRNMT